MKNVSIKIKEFTSYFLGLFLWPIYLIISTLEGVIEAGLLIYIHAHNELPGMEKFYSKSEVDKTRWMKKYGNVDEFYKLALDSKFSYSFLKTEQLVFLFEFLSIYRSPDKQGCVFDFNYKLVDRQLRRRDDAIGIVRWWVNVWITLVVACLTLK